MLFPGSTKSDLPTLEQANLYWRYIWSSRLYLLRLAGTRVHRSVRLFILIRVRLRSGICLLHLCRNRSAPVANEVARTVKVSSSYVPLHEALQYKWSSLTKRQTKELNPAAFFTVLGQRSVLSFSYAL